MIRLNDIEIIDSVLKGNVNDFSLIVEKYKDRAFNLCYSILKNEMDAEEVLQDAFIKAFNSLKSFKQESKFSTWFYRIVYNTALSKLKSKERKVDSLSDSIENYYDLEETDYKEYEEESISMILEKSINTMDPKSAMVIILYYMDNLKINEIAGIMGLSIVNTKVLLHRGRKKLREILIKNNFREEFL